MKKLISSIIIILPLLLLVILLVSGAIVSLLTHIYVEKIEFSNNEAIVLVMDDELAPPTHNLKDDITILPLKATNRDLVYTNYDSSLLQISDDGVITPLFYGETYVTVQSRENAAATATRKVIVTDVSVHALRFNDYAQDMYQGETAQLSVAVYPQQAQNKAVNWSSSDSSILQVSSNGTVTSLGNGTATVTATSADDPSVQATATINCHAKLNALVFDNSLFQTSLTTARFPAVTSDPAKCDLQYACDNTDIADVDQSGNITFKREGKVTVTVTGTDYKGNTVQGQKVFVSTFGYFVGPLFDIRALKYEDCQVGEALPLNFVPKLEGSYQLIGKIEYAFDGTVVSGEGLTGLIEYDEASKQFILKGAFPEFNDYVDVLVHSTVYDNDSNTLDATYEDYFRIEKHEIPERAKAYCNGAELTAGGVPNDIVVEDIGGSATLTIDNPDNLRVQINSTQGVTVSRSGDAVTLTGNFACDGEIIKLSIGSKVYNLRVIVHAKAQRIDVKYGGEPMTDGETYRTLLNELTFAVQSGRDDNQTVTNPVKYQLNNTGTWHEISDGSATLSLTSETTVQFLCDDIQFTLYLSKVTLDDFGFEASYTKSDGSSQLLQSVASVLVQDNLMFILPSDVQNNVTLQLNVAEFEQYLGGFGDSDDFQNLFSVQLPDGDGWKVDYNAGVGQIVVNFTQPEFNKIVKLLYGTTEVSLQLVKVNVQSISFVNKTESFSSNNSDDVHKGYQQVRVFAKHSYYDGKAVDYFRIPLNALSNVALQTPASVDTISWTLSRYVGTACTKVLVRQLGDIVTIGSQVYKIVPQGGEYVLQDANGNAVSGVDGLNRDGYVWVDVYTEKEQGYARIYFGNFNGLREVDVQNDYFGNFDDKPTWTQPQQVVDDNSGRAFDTAENSFTFLRVEAGDDVEGGKNCHFNFNVLDDTTLVNVFDAEGYYENDNIVLHTDLYGPGELGDSGEDFDKATEKGLFLTKTSNLGKTLLYGNGYQVNMQVYNEEIATDLKNHPSNYTNGFNESIGVTFNKAYNAVIKCANPSETLNGKTQTLVLKMSYAYYCNLSYYYKFNPIGTFYTKNTLFSYIPKTAMQLYYNETVYVENVVFTECGTTIMVDNKDQLNPHIYFKGSLDILNYYNKQGLEDFNPLIGTMFAEVVPNVQKYVEWHGKDLLVKANSTAADANTDKVYVNIALYGLAPLTENVFVWNGSDYAKAIDTPLTNGSKLVSKKLNTYKTIVGDLYAWTYDTLDENGNRLDNANIDVDIFIKAHLKADLSQLYTNKRYIRLQCEYKKSGEKNYTHILWHMQEIYRDKSLIVGRKLHLDDLKDSLKNTEWFDGTGVDADGNIIDTPIAAALRSLSCAVLPAKQEYLR